MRQLEVLNPDVLLVQELHPLIMQCILKALPEHACVQDDFLGWTQEGNIFFRKSMFTEVSHGCMDIGQCEPNRRLFWARLECAQSHKKALFATAHFTWQGHPAECESDVNLRKAQARKTAAALDSLQSEDEPCFFGGDLNEGYWPKRVLSEAGFVDCFSALQFPCLATHPTRPSVAHEEHNADHALDWLFARSGCAGEHRAKRQCTNVVGGTRGLRPMLASVIRDMCALSSSDKAEMHVLAVQPSDHCPVMAVYRF